MRNYTREENMRMRNYTREENPKPWEISRLTHHVHELEEWQQNQLHVDRHHEPSLEQLAIRPSGHLAMHPMQEQRRNVPYKLNGMKLVEEEFDKFWRIFRVLTMDRKCSMLDHVQHMVHARHMDHSMLAMLTIQLNCLQQKLPI